ncbi:MAG: hypothetical protein AB7O56_10335 [Bauldia sp.]
MSALPSSTTPRRSAGAGLLGFSAGQRLALAAVAIGALWLLVWWAL